MTTQQYIMNGNYRLLDQVMERMDVAEEKVKNNVLVPVDLWYEVISSVKDKSLLSKIAALPIPAKK